MWFVLIVVLASACLTCLLSSGHVWTRIVQKGASALGVLKEYATELEVLDALLSQHRWRCGKRGAWYDRKACILMTHCGKNKATLEKALEVVIEGLKDDDTHISQRYFWLLDKPGLTSFEQFIALS
jgi:hypothetical protein